MTDGPASGIEAALQSLLEARERAGQAARTLREDGADGHLVEALEESERDLLHLYERLERREAVA